jgi:hypothetical protein
MFLTWGLILNKIRFSRPIYYCLLFLFHNISQNISVKVRIFFFFLWRAPQQAYCEPCDDDDFFFFLCNGAPVEWNWQGETEVLGEKTVLVPLCPPQIPHGLTRDWTRSSAVRCRLLTWAMARPVKIFDVNLKMFSTQEEFSDIITNVSRP